MRLKNLERNNQDLSIRKQCFLLSINRSNLYYQPSVFADDSDIANEISELWSKYCFFGYRKITAVLNKQRGYNINRKKVLRLMREAGLQAVYARPRTTVMNKEHNKYPYLLRDLTIDKANQVWATDITYIKMPKGFVYLTALIDLFSRFILSWKISITMDTEFCITTLNQALKLGKPEIVNTDQGSQFTSNEWIGQILENSIKVSMDGIGRWVDNIYIERFWRTVKQEQIYINPPDNITELKEQVNKFINFYNHQRPHQSLDYQTPAQVYYEIKRN